MNILELALKADGDDPMSMLNDTDAWLERFAALIREECAKRIEQCDCPECSDCAAAIRGGEMSNQCEWAKIVQASSGEYVLFYVEQDTENDDCSVIHCYSRHDGFDADMKLDGIPNEKVASAMAEANQEQADRVLRGVTGMMGDE